MGRMACIDLPALPLQLLLRRHPDWRGLPAAVVDQDKPQGELLWVNERARARRILPGMRYAAALTLDRDLRVDLIAADEVARCIKTIGKRLLRFSPGVEPAEEQPGVFWLDASGLERLYDSLADWAEEIQQELRGAGFKSTTAVGFSRFGCYAAARSKRGRVVFRSRDEERAVAHRVPLTLLGIEPAVRDALRKLGVDRVGRFVELPPDGLEKRFGPELLHLHRLATDLLRLPVQPHRPAEPAVERLPLDHPETDVARLLYAIERMLPGLIATLSDRSEQLAGLDVGFRFERLGDHLESLRPAAPTLDATRLLELVRLRLEGLRRLPDGVTEIRLLARSVKAAREQRQLYAERPRRDLEAADRALARLRAELGDEAVRFARLREGHLPEAGFSWESLDHIGKPSPRGTSTSRLVRRIYTRPLPLPSRSRHEPDGWLLRDLEQGPVVKIDGPYVVSGGWWNRPVQREYHFAETRKGELLWIFYDRGRRRWFLQGRVE
jgi:protein ImuB